MKSRPRSSLLRFSHGFIAIALAMLASAAASDRKDYPVLPEPVSLQQRNVSLVAALSFASMSQPLVFDGVFFPDGVASFADKVVSYGGGNPRPSSVGAHDN
jgi:hypothetical protein